MLKTCKKCGEIKELPQFYKHPKMKDGYLNICISCKKADAIEYRNDNRDKIKQQDRERNRSEHRTASRLEYIKRLKENSPDQYKNMKSETVKKSNAKYPEKRKARNQIEMAIRAGNIIKPERCEKCGEKSTVEAHHFDYSKPLEVMWLCHFCHGREHRK